ncbi:MAG TPA: hypothetical protein VF847_01670 [Candidatus Deferrimicrobiaceae bacterium]
MRRCVEWGLGLLALVLTAATMAGVSRWGASVAGGSVSPSAADRYYHAGKVPLPSVGKGGCCAPECHPVFPHAKVRTQAAFRNMHVRFADCLACHGKDARKSWVAEPVAAGAKGGAGGSVRPRWRIASAETAVAREKMHERLGPALSCRACHSDEGLREIAAKGIRDLSAGFANPVPLRMIEEGAKQWIPDTMR